jgi:hypothetical protein
LLHGKIMQQPIQRMANERRIRRVNRPPPGYAFR